MFSYKKKKNRKGKKSLRKKKINSKINKELESVYRHTHTLYIYIYKKSFGIFNSSNRFGLSKVHSIKTLTALKQAY